MAPLTVDRLAAYRAAVDAGLEPALVLADLGEAPATWRQREEFLLNALSDEADRGIFNRIEAYQTAYRDALAARGGRAAAERVDEGEPPGAADLDTTSEVVRPPLAPTLPFAGTVSGLSVSAPHSNPPLREGTQDALDTTAQGGVAVANALPFAGGADDEPDPEADRTAQRVEGGVAARLRFAPAGADAADVPTSPLPPFTGPGTRSVATEEIDIGQLLAAPSAITPEAVAVAAPNLARPPRLSVEQHATLCAELAQFPQQKGEILTRYGLTAVDRAAEDGYWNDRMVGDASARRVWLSTLARVREAIRHRG